MHIGKRNNKRIEKETKFMIEHDGVVEKINGNHIVIRILQQSACSECHAKGACMAADKKEKLIDVNDVSGEFRVNERVVVQGKTSIGYKAVLWAFVLPLIILVGVLILAVSVWKMSEMQSALFAFLALVPYYFVLFLSRKKIAQTLQFTIKKTN